LGIVNGLMLMKFYLRDKAKLTVEPVHPETYQWWFRHRDGDFQGNPTRRYGFITYIDVTNSGLRKVQLSSWRLFIRSRLRKWVELKPINMPEPSIAIGEHRKLYPVLGQRGLNFEGDTTVESGGSCGKSKGKPHLKADHDYQRDARLPQWHGWHAARRGLGSNLYRLGVPPMVIQRILRHANVSTTATYYIKTAADDVRNAMAKLEKTVTENPGSELRDTFGTLKPIPSALPESIN
jgi:integrase